MPKTHLARLGRSLFITLGLTLTACGGGSTDGSDALQPGVLYFSQDRNGNGLFIVDTATGAATLAGNGVSGTTASTVGLTGNGSVDSLYGSTWQTVHLIQADGSASAEVQAVTAEGLAFSTVTGLLYRSINGTFSSVDPVTGTEVALMGPGTDAEGIACDSASGFIYAINDDNSNLQRYDIATGTWSVVGDTGITWSGAGLAYDPVSGWLYATGNGGNLHRINPTNASTTIVGPLNLPGGSLTGGLGMTAPRAAR